MKNVIQIFNELKLESSKGGKEMIIKSNLDNPLFVECMQFLLDPFVLTGISSKKAEKTIYAPTSNLDDLSALMNYFKVNNTGRDADIGVLRNFVTRFETFEEVDFVYGLITKSIKLGVDTLWNKTVPKDMKIPEFSLLLAKSYNDHKDKVKGEFVITTKLDGLRLLIVKENGKCRSYSRTGKEYTGLNEVESEIENIDYLDNYVFDGELLSTAEGNTNEVFAETMKNARTKNKDKKNLVFHVFDFMPLDEFKQGKSKKKAVQRKKELSQLMNDINFKHLQEVKPLYIGSDKSQIEVWKQYAMENEWEGVMVSLDAPYECKRSSTLLKVKPFLDCDAKVVGILEGEGRNVGRLGAITIQFEHLGNVWECKCGSGFSDSERELYWKHPELIVGKICVIQYFEISKNEDGGHSLRFPTWKNRITDKTEISMN